MKFGRMFNFCVVTLGYNEKLIFAQQLNQAWLELSDIVD